MPLAGEVVTRILRVSRARVEGSTMEQLFAARRRVQGPSRVAGLCGAVLHIAGWYVLWQEGPEDAIEEALRTSLRKARPDVPRLVHRSVGPRTLSEPLAVSTTQWIESPDAFARRIDAVAAAGLAPRETWRAFAEPPTLPAPPEGAPAGSVGLLASVDARAIETARNLAGHFERPLVYRRFAGADPKTTDVGMAYVDLAVGGRSLRVHAAGRRVFGHPLVQSSMARPGHVALLAGSGDRAALDLAIGISSFLGAGPQQPCVDVVGEVPLVAAGLRDEVQRRTGATARVHEGAFTDSQLVALLLGLVPMQAG
ncbi:hypothetical protein [Ramlibacter algicola]|uniref:Uncharacterized protein n=1 Tax=Ramlibacter algicola TaxID=2795217 RepID=A0A934Q4S9_9BURK|nr:hypothetical protein [Ramlibacter algicola]MBK0394259.1 hypothetical protein [Ramlibacter algicola]